MPTLSSKLTSASTTNAVRTLRTRAQHPGKPTAPANRRQSTNESSHPRGLVAPCGKLFGSCPRERPIRLSCIRKLYLNLPFLLSNQRGPLQNFASTFCVCYRRRPDAPVI